MEQNIDKLLEYYHRGWNASYDEVVTISENDLRAAFNLGRLDSELEKKCLCTPSEGDNDIINKLISLV